MKEELITVLLAMAPTSEAHGALAAAIGVFRFSPLKAYLLTVLGTGGVIVPLLFFWHRLSGLLMERIYIVNRFLTWLFSYTHRRHTHHFSLFGETEAGRADRADFWKAIALFVFVAVPGPLTGVWAGTVAAFVFGIPFWHAVAALTSGALAVAAIDLGILVGFFSFIR